MNKNIFFRLAIACGVLVAVVLWILSVALPDAFGFFNASWFFAIVCCISGIACVVKGILSKDLLSARFAYLGMGALLAVVGVISAVCALQAPNGYIMPVIALVIVAVAIVVIVVSGGTNWDKGDNQKEGYQTYAERKAAQKSVTSSESEKIEPQSGEKK